MRAKDEVAAMRDGNGVAATQQEPRCDAAGDAALGGRERAGTSRRTVLRRLATAAALLPMIRYGGAIAEAAERHRRRKELAECETFWIGHS